MINPRVVKNPNFKNGREFHTSLKARGIGAKDFPNTHTEVEHLGSGKFAASLSLGHRVFFDKADGHKPKKHKLTDERPSKDYVLVQGAKCCTEVYPYYAKYFDVQHEEVRVEEERWIVQRWSEPPGQWQDIGAWNPVITVEEYPEPAGDVVSVKVDFDTDFGVLTVEYFQRDGNNLKHDVTFKNTSGSTETFRVLQRWAGIVGNRVKTHEGASEIITKKILTSLKFTFGSPEKPLLENLSGVYWGENFNQDLERAKWEIHGECNECKACCKAFGCWHYKPDLPDKCDLHIKKAPQQWRCEEETLGEWRARKDPRCMTCFQPVFPSQIEDYPECNFTYTPKVINENTKIPNCLLRPVVVDIGAQGMKADFIYGDWILAQNESLEIDPDTATLDNPAEDGHIDTAGATYNRSDVNVTIYIGQGPAKKGGVLYRGYVEWDVSTITDGWTITETKFRYEGYTHNVDCHIHEMMGTRPTGQPDNPAGNQAIFDEAGEGTVYADPAGFPEVGINKEVDLGAAADADLEASLAGNWFAIGLQADSESSNVESRIYSEDKTDAPTPKPTLYVVYEEPSLGLENKSANMGAKMIGHKMV